MSGPSTPLTKARNEEDQSNHFRRRMLKLPRLGKKTRVELSWLLKMIFSKDLEQMLTLRGVELITRIATDLGSPIRDPIARISISRPS